MIALSMTDVKKTMQTLLMATTFDSFLVQEIVITKDVTLALDGHIHPAFYTSEEIAADPSLTESEYATYKSMRNVIASFIQGSKTPLSFKFILHAPASYLKNLTSNPAFTGDPADIKALILTFRFEQGKLTCLTGTAYQTFTLDKSIDELWDKAICKSFDKIEIPFQQLG